MTSIFAVPEHADMQLRWIESQCEDANGSLRIAKISALALAEISLDARRITSGQHIAMWQCILRATTEKEICDAVTFWSKDQRPTA